MFGALFYSMISDTTDEAGSYGEMIVNNTIKTKAYQGVTFRLFKDVYIDGPDRVNQIDHIFVMKTGIFVVETKMFSNGVIIGNEDDEIWVNKKGGHVTQFLNPIIQNQSHVRALMKLIGDSYEIVPLVVFAWGNKPTSCKDPSVLNYSEFINYPLNYKPRKELSDEDIERVCSILTENEKYKTELKEKHKEQMKNLKKHFYN